MRFNEKTSPAEEPLTLPEAKLHLRVGSDFVKEDGLINGLIVGSRQAFQKQIGRQLITATWQVFLDRFPRFDREPVEIPKPPLQSVTSVQYLDSSGALQTWSNTKYTVEAFAGPEAERGVLFPNFDEQYPITRRIPNAVTIEYVAGYGLAAAVPYEIKQALFAWIGHHYEHREKVVVGTIASKVPGLDFEPWKDMDFG